MKSGKRPRPTVGRGRVCALLLLVLSAFASAGGYWFLGGKIAAGERQFDAGQRQLADKEPALAEDRTPLSKDDSETLRRLDPLGRIAGKGGTTNVLRFPDLSNACEMRLRAAARQQDADITDPEALKTLADKRKEAVERARQRRLQGDKSQE